MDCDSASPIRHRVGRAGRAPDGRFGRHGLGRRFSKILPSRSTTHSRSSSKHPSSRSSVSSTASFTSRSGAVGLGPERGRGGRAAAAHEARVQLCRPRPLGKVVAEVRHCEIDLRDKASIGRSAAVRHAYPAGHVDAVRSQEHLGRVRAPLGGLLHALGRPRAPACGRRHGSRSRHRGRGSRFGRRPALRRGPQWRRQLRKGSTTSESGSTPARWHTSCAFWR